MNVPPCTTLPLTVVWVVSPSELKLSTPVAPSKFVAAICSSTFARVTGVELLTTARIAAKITRTIQLAKVQDVRVEQRLSQRIFNVGNLSIETAGEASRLTLPRVDDPHKLAEEILNRAQAGNSAGTP